MISNNNKPQIILGIDPGYDRVGLAILHKQKTTNKVIYLGLIQTKKTDDYFVRYQQILTELQEVLTKYKPEIAIIETLFFSKNKKTALRVSEARGLIIAKLLEHKIEVKEISPNQVKLAITGNGGADKQSVSKMLSIQTGLNLDKITDDVLDALAVGYSF